MSPRARIILIVLLLIALAGVAYCFGVLGRRELSRESETSIERWLACIECQDGERERVVAIARVGDFEEAVVTLLADALLREPDSAALAQFDQQVAAALAAVGDTTIAPAAFIARYRENFLALRQKRAVLALGDIGTPPALTVLDSARSDTARYRPDVRRALEQVGNALTGAPTTIVARAGDGQAAPIGATIAVDPSVVVTDEAGQPVAGVEVVFEVGSGGGSVGADPGASAATATAATNSDGMASAAWRLGPEATNTLLAYVPLLPDTVVFTATATGPPAAIVIVSGDGQSATRGTVLREPPVVRVLDAAGGPVAGVALHFEVIEGGGRVADPTRTSNGTGQASPGFWELGPAVGPNRLAVEVAGGGPATTLSAEALEPRAPFSMSPRAGDGQSAAAGAPVRIAPAVGVVDADGQPVAGVQVSFRVLPPAVGGVGRIVGRVTDASGVSVGNVQLAIEGTAIEAIANSQGQYALADVPRGLRTVRFVRVGYRALVVEELLVLPGETVVVDVSLEETAVPLPAQILPGDQAPGVERAQATTDASGTAKVRAWRLRQQPGPNGLEATSPLVQDSVIFTATGT